MVDLTGGSRDHGWPHCHFIGSSEEGWQLHRSFKPHVGAQASRALEARSMRRTAEPSPHERSGILAAGRSSGQSVCTLERSRTFFEMVPPFLSSCEGVRPIPKGAGADLPGQRSPSPTRRLQPSSPLHQGSSPRAGLVTQPRNPTTWFQPRCCGIKLDVTLLPQQFFLRTPPFLVDFWNSLFSLLRQQTRLCVVPATVIPHCAPLPGF